MPEFNPKCNVRRIFNCAPEHFLREALMSGELITCTTGGTGEPDPRNYTQLLRRDPSGNWRRSAKFAHPGAGIFTTELFTPAPGVIHAFYQYHHLGEWLTRLENRRTISRDGGLTWSAPELLPGGINNLWTGKGIVHSSGRWIIPASFADPVTASTDQDRSNPIEWVKRNFDCRCCTIVSDDKGVSFRRSVPVRSLGKHLIEPRLVELSNGSLLMLIRSMDDQILFRSISRDGGFVWSEAVASEIPNPSAKILLLRAANGNLVLVHNPVTGRRSRLEAWVSDDDALTWKRRIEIARDQKRNLNYPDGEFDKDGNLRLIWEDARSIFSAELKYNDLFE